MRLLKLKILHQIWWTDTIKTFATEAQSSQKIFVFSGPLASLSTGFSRE